MTDLQVVDAVTMYLQARRLRMLSPHTTARTMRELRDVAAILADGAVFDVATDGSVVVPDDAVPLPLSAVTAPALEVALGRYADGAGPGHGRPRSRGTVAGACSTWSTFLAWLVTRGVLPGNPMAGVARPRIAKPTPKAVGDAEDTIRRLLEAAASGRRPMRRGVPPWPERDVAVIATLTVTAIRSGELRQAAVGDLDRSPTGAVLRIRHGKGGKQRWVPVPEPLLHALDAYLASRVDRFPPAGGSTLPATAPLFTRDDGQRFGPSGVYDLVRSVARAAGVAARFAEGALVHGLRHTALTDMARRGVGVMVISAIAGHGDIGTTQRYLLAAGREGAVDAVSDSTAAAAVDSLGLG